MKVIFITGTPGCGKSTLEANIRYQVGARDGTLDFELVNNILFIGRMVGENGKPLRITGFDNFKGSLKRVIERAEFLNIDYIVIAHCKQLVKQVEKLETPFHYFVHLKRACRILRQRKKRRNKSEHFVKDNVALTRMNREIQKLKNLPKSLSKHPNIQVTILTGNTRNRVNMILSEMKRPLMNGNVIRKSYRHSLWNKRCTRSF